MSKTKDRAKSDGKYTIHPVCQLIPPMSAEDRARLRAGIERDGEIRVPIIVLGNEIIDGRNRWEISRELRLSCPSVKYKGPKDMASLAAYVMSLNVERRHMTTSQLTACAAELSRIIEASRSASDTDKSKDVANLPRTNRQDKGQQQPSSGRSNEIAAKAMGVSTRSVTSAKAVMEKAPDLHEKVKAGELTVHAATQEMKRREEAPAEPEKPEPIKDANGTEIPEKLTGVFSDARFEEIASQLRAVKKNIKALADDPLAVWLHQQDVLGNLENVIKAIKFARPHALCPYCRPTGNKGCKACRKAGWMPVEVYAAVPEADK